MQKKENQGKVKSKVDVMSAVLFAESNERKRFSNLIHDEIGPYLSILKLKVENLCQECSRKCINSTLVESIHNTVTIVANKLRSLSFSMSPEVLSRIGITKSLQNYISYYNGSKDIQVDMHSEIDSIPDKHIEEVIYRIITEFICNSFKHSGASQIRLSLRQDANILHIDYSDNGVGFSISEAKNKSGCQGLFNVITRLEAISAGYQMKSSKGKGFRCLIKVNMNGKSQRDYHC